MKNQDHGGLATLLRKNEADILADWIREQSVGQKRKDPVQEAEVRRVSKEFLAASLGALQGSGSVGGRDWDPVREILSEMSATRASQGSTPAETAMFVFSLKQELFSALRGMLRPLLVTDTVDLVFEEPSGVPLLFTDESKVSQILRNFVSNALKFTEAGAVTVRARLAEDGEAVVFSVTDSGIGIAEEDLELIFEEFAQLPNPLQRKVKGTGLGRAR